MVWLKYVVCLVIILFAGTKLARYGDAIGEKTGLGRIWIGLALLAAAARRCWWLQGRLWPWGARRAVTPPNIIEYNII